VTAAIRTTVPAAVSFLTALAVRRGIRIDAWHISDAQIRKRDLDMRRKLLIGTAALGLAAGVAVPVSMVATAATSLPPVGTLYACVDGPNRTVEHAYTQPGSFASYLDGHGGTCPNGFAVGIGAAPSPTPTVTTTSPVPTPTTISPTPTTISPTPTTTSPTPTTTSPTPTPTTTSPTPTGAACVQTSPDGDHCGPYLYPPVVMSNGFDTYVGNNCWGDPTCKFTTTVTDPGHWSTVATEPAGQTAVVAYPDVQQLTDDWCGSGWNTTSCPNPTGTPLSALTSLTSTFTEAMPHDTGTIAEFGYDLWTNYSSDIMIWTDNVNRGAGGANLLASDQVIGGQSFDVYQYGGAGGEIIFSLNDAGGSGTFANETSGTVDILGTLAWVQSHGYASNISIGQIDAGWEICSTGGGPETFTMSGFTLTGG
jgi:hypothetical protein